MITMAVKRGDIVYVYGEGMKLLFTLNCGSDCELIGHTHNTVTLKRNNRTYIYNEQGDPFSPLNENSLSQENQQNDDKMITLEEINEEIGKSVIINVNRTYNDISLYEATRKCWKMNIDKARQAEYAISEYHGEIVGVFKPTSWSVCDEYPDRISFEGEDVTENYRQYLGLIIPRQIGNQSPIRYSYNYDDLGVDEQENIQSDLVPPANENQQNGTRGRGRPRINPDQRSSKPVIVPLTEQQKIDLNNYARKLGLNSAAAAIRMILIQNNIIRG